MKKRRKHRQCLNCGQNLHQSHNYCSHCGQENTDHEVSLGLLLREFLSNFFSLDSRFGRTIKPFLFRPGKITTEFIAGRRVKYANPFRWYLVISIFHFFFFSLSGSDDNSENQGVIRFETGTPEITAEQFDSLYYLPDSLHEKNWLMADHKFRLMLEMNEDGKLSPRQVMDSLHLNEKPWLKRQMIHKLIKINQDSASTVSEYLLRQIPVIMFFILPLYALLLKLFFWRRGRYIHHLIHSLHIHSFAFFLLGWIWLVFLFMNGGAAATAWLQNALFIAFLIITVYLFLSIRRVYQVRWFSIVYKMLLMGVSYTIALVASLLVGIFVSLLMY